jgi:hypothetical protein
VVLALGILAVVTVMVYSSATSAVFTLAVYRYAQDDKTHGPFTQHDLANPFVGAVKNSWRIRTLLGRARRSKGEPGRQTGSPG